MRSEPVAEDDHVELRDSGMFSHEVPLEVYPQTYHRKPLMYAALASQKNHMAVYLCGMCGVRRAGPPAAARGGIPGVRQEAGLWSRLRALPEARGYPLELIGEPVAAVPMRDFVAHAESCKSAPRKR